MTGEVTAWTAGCACGDVYVAGHYGLAPRTAAAALAEQRGCWLDAWHPTDVVRFAADTRTVINLGAELAPPEIERAERAAWVDCIAWLRHQPPPTLDLYDVRIAEAYFPLGPGSPLTEGAPLVQSMRIPRQPRESHSVVVSLGGVYSLAMTQADVEAALRFVIAGLSTAFSQATRFTCVILLPDALLSWAREQATADGLKFLPVRAGAFQEQLAHCAAAIVQPGLAGPFEAFLAAVPTMLTLPFSWTQLHQAFEFEAHGLTDRWGLWNRYLEPFRNASRDVADEESVCAALGDAQRYLMRDSAVVDEFSDRIMTFLGRLEDRQQVDERLRYAEQRLALPSIAAAMGSH